MHDVPGPLQPPRSPSTVPNASDPSDMAASIAGMPSHLRIGREIGAMAGARLLPPAGVVVAGMGGSAIGGELLRALVADDCPVPITRVRGYGIPKWAGPGTLVACVSYSGETTETLACAQQAASQGAHVLAVTAGGTLGSFAEHHGFTTAIVPGGLMPRAALGYLFGALAGAFGASGLADGSMVEECARGAETCDIASAEAIGRQLAHTIPLISGSGPLAAVAYRWKTQFNENAKIHAFSHAFPEFAHNEIMGWEGAGNWPFAMVTLTDLSDSQHLSRMIAASMDVVRSYSSRVTAISGVGSTRNARAFNLVATGDWASYFAAIERNVDPTPIESIMSLKRNL